MEHVITGSLSWTRPDVNWALPLSSGQLEKLLKRCGFPHERLLVLILHDLEGRPVHMAKITIADYDRVGGLLRLGLPDGRSERVRLGSETMRAFHEYTLSRNDTNPSLFVGENGGQLTEGELRETMARLTNGTGLEFDVAGFRFRPSKAEQGPRIVAKTASKDMFYLYGIVSHPLRRRIVELLGDGGPIGFSQIKKRLDVRVGTLYYHFDMLAGLVAQDRQKRYLLTEAGKDAYRKLRSPEYVQSTGLLGKSLPSTLTGVERGLRLIVPGRLLAAVQRFSPLAVLGAAFLLGLGALGSYRESLETVVFFPNPSSTDPFQLGLLFLGNWLLVFTVADGIATFLLGRKGEHLVLLVGTAYALIPLLVFMGWWELATALTLQAPGLTTIAISRIILVVFQAWALVLMARIVSVLKGLRLDKAAVVSLVLAYLSITIAYVRGF